MDLQKYLSVQSKAALKRIQEHPADVPAWQHLISQLRDMPLHYTRNLWTQYLTHFPTCPGSLAAYLRAELNALNYATVRRFFEPAPSAIAFLCPYTPVWMLYLQAVERSAPNTKEVHEAYVTAKGVIGPGLDSAPFWRKYIDFLEENVAADQQAAQVRLAYHEALMTPFDKVDMFWKPYEEWEAQARDHRLKAAISKELERAHKRACYTVGELVNKIFVGIDEEHLPQPLGQGDCDACFSQYLGWRRVIAHELSNPLGFDKDAKIVARVMFAYRRAFAHCPHNVEFWLELTTYLLNSGGTLHQRQRADDALNIFEHGVRLLPLSVVLHAAFADALMRDLSGSSLSAAARQARGHDLFKGIVQRTRVAGQEGQCAIAYALYLRWARFSNPHSGVEDAQKIYAEAVAEDPSRRVVLVQTMAEIEMHQSHSIQSALEVYARLTPEEHREVYGPYCDLLVLSRSYDEALTLLKAQPQSPCTTNQIALIEHLKSFIAVPRRAQDYAVLLGEEGLFPCRDAYGTICPPPPIQDEQGPQDVTPLAGESRMEVSLRAHTMPSWLALTQPVDNMGLEEGLGVRVIRASALQPFRPTAGGPPVQHNTTFLQKELRQVDDDAVPYGMKADDVAPDRSTQKVFQAPKSVYTYYVQSSNPKFQKKRPREVKMPLSTLPKSITKLLEVLPAAVGVVGIEEPMLFHVPSVAFLINTLQNMGPVPSIGSKNI